jgi:hypothetical protein
MFFYHWEQFKRISNNERRIMNDVGRALQRSSVIGGFDVRYSDFMNSEFTQTRQNKKEIRGKYRIIIPESIDVI